MSELAYIREGQSEREAEDKSMPMKWHELFRHRNIWGCASASS